MITLTLCRELAVLWPPRREEGRGVGAGEGRRVREAREEADAERQRLDIFAVRSDSFT